MLVAGDNTKLTSGSWPQVVCAVATENCTVIVRSATGSA
jgi:hypothetical protein